MFAEAVVHVGVGVCMCGSVCVCKGAHSPVTQMMRETGLGSSRNFC